MKTIQSLLILGLLGFCSTLFISCSQDIEEDVAGASGHESYVYAVYLDCTTPSFDEATTRAATSWSNADKLYLRFKNGGQWVSGTAVYNLSAKNWTLSASSPLNIASGATTCTAYFFQNEASSSSTKVTLTEKSIVYYGQGSYTHPNTSDIYLSVTLDPYTWRMRFSGTSGTSMTLESSSDIYYYSAFDCTTGALTSDKKSVTLSVASNGYTPYVYGHFASPTGDNTIKLTSGGHTFYKILKGSTLNAKMGAYLALPNMSNYNDNGWWKESKYVSNCNCTTSYPVAFTDRIITEWNVGANVGLCWVRIYKSSEISSLSNDEIIKKMTSSAGVIETKESIEGYAFRYSGLSPSTSYVLCTYCTDINGDHGDLVKYSFTTLSTSSPQAEITNPRYNNTEHLCTVVKRYNAYSFYLACGQGSYWFNIDEDFCAHEIRKRIDNGTFTNVNYNFTTYYFSKSSSYVAFITWARSSSGVMGNCDVFQGVASSRRESNDAPASNYKKISVDSLKVLSDCMTILAY